MNMSDQQIKEIYNAAAFEKDIARKSRDNSDHFMTASELYANAASLCNEMISSLNKKEAIKYKVLYSYYYFESFDSLAGYEYYRSNYNESSAYIKKAITQLLNAIKIVKKNLAFLKKEKGINFEKLLVGWKHSLNSSYAMIYGINARNAFEKNDFITARDNYAKVVDISEKNWKEIKDDINIDQVYKRIALGNLIASRSNFQKSFSAIIYEKAKNNSGVLSLTDYEKLLSLTLDIFELGKEAYEANPEWEQYSELLKSSRNNILVLLDSDREYWPTVLVKFGNNKEVVSIMKQIDKKRYDKIVSSGSEQWSMFALFTMLLVIISAITYLFITSGKNLLIVVFGLLFIQTAITIIGAFILRSVDKINQKNFMNLVKMSLKNQFGAFALMVKNKKNG